MRWFHLFIILSSLLLLSCETTQQPDAEPSYTFSEKYRCLGNPRAKNHAVYLHGFTDENMSGQEKVNYRNLSKLAGVLDMMIAIPSSTKSCLKDGRRQRCWGTEMTQSEAESALVVAKKAARKCFPRNRPYGLIGFSNGGYVATKVFSYCLAPKQAPLLRWIVTAVVVAVAFCIIFVRSLLLHGEPKTTCCCRFRSKTRALASPKTK